ncbi:MAG: hypothetical protein R3C01_06085 [Planctomycetaceae bacterium]
MGLVLRSLTLGLFLLAITLPAVGEDLYRDVPPRKGSYTPQHHMHRPGQSGEWALQAKPVNRGFFQPVRIEVPTEGLVSFYSSEQQQPILAQAPAQAGMLVGRLYRFRIAGMPEYPGVELYPTVEILSRMHTPVGREEEFPIPIFISEDEIEMVLKNQMVNKVIYLEAPQTASPIAQEERGIVTFDIPSQRNLLDAAHQLGRPMAILRIGGRQPDPNNPFDELLRATAPVRVAPLAPSE